MSGQDDPYGADDWGTRHTPWGAPPGRTELPADEPVREPPERARVRRPPSHVVLALVGTVVSVPWLFGVPFGLVALVAAVRVLRGHDDPELAAERSERARRWGWGAVLVTLLVMLVQVVTSSPWSVFDGG